MEETEQKEGVLKRKSKASHSFVIALSIVSIVGFVSIVTESLFSYSINPYIESAWLIALGAGLIFETSVRELKSIKDDGLGPEMLGKLTMMIVGIIAIIAAIWSLPQIKSAQPVFLAIKGIVSILAIIFIIIQTWITKKE